MGSQAALLESPWKFICLGNRQRLLFNVSLLDGESLERNLIDTQADLPARLKNAFQAWGHTLTPPGIPDTFDAHHEGMFEEHGMIAPRPGAPKKKDEYAGFMQGWFSRNGDITFRNGELTLTPDLKAPRNLKSFVVRSGLELDGPSVSCFGPVPMPLWNARSACVPKK